MDKVALIAGATGLTGQHLLQLLLASSRYRQVKVLTRRDEQVEHPKAEMVKVDWDRLEDFTSYLEADDIFCGLGTTMKKAGSKEAFQKVDYQYPLDLARLTLEQGAQQYLLISAMGADADSMFFYNRVKGQLEDDLAKLAFRSIHIFRPSLLLGERQEERKGEETAKVVMNTVKMFMRGPLRKYQPIHVARVAKDMLDAAAAEEAGIHIHQNHEMLKG